MLVGNIWSNDYDEYLHFYAPSHFPQNQLQVDIGVSNKGNKQNNTERSLSNSCKIKHEAEHQEGHIPMLTSGFWGSIMSRSVKTKQNHSIKLCHHRDYVKISQHQLQLTLILVLVNVNCECE